MGRSRINDYSILQITDNTKGIKKSYKVALPEKNLASIHTSTFEDVPIDQEDLITIINHIGNIIKDVMEKVDKETTTINILVPVPVITEDFIKAYGNKNINKATDEIENILSSLTPEQQAEILKKFTPHS